MSTTLKFVIWILLIQKGELLGPPRPDTNEIEAEVYLGQKIKLTCPISVDKQLYFSWFKDGEKIYKYDSKWTNYIMNGRSLTISKAEMNDSGTFLCRGVNGFGKAEINIYLYVIDPNHGNGISSTIIDIFDLLSFLLS